MLGYLFEIIIILMVLVVIFTALSMTFYKKCPPGSMLVIFSGKSDVYGNNFKIVKSGGAFVWPIGSWHVVFDLSPFSINFELENLMDKNENSIYFKSRIILAISSNENDVQYAIERISGLDKGKINELCIDLISSHIRSFFSGISFEETKGREKATLNITEALKLPLEEIGIKIMNLDIIEIKKK